MTQSQATRPPHPPFVRSQVSGDCVAYGTLIDLYASAGSLEQVTPPSLPPYRPPLPIALYAPGANLPSLTPSVIVVVLD